LLIKDSAAAAAMALLLQTHRPLVDVASSVGSSPHKLSDQAFGLLLGDLQ
jgi:hypothetical protein